MTIKKFIARTIIFTVVTSIALGILYSSCVDPTARIVFGFVALILALIWASENA